MSYRLIAHQIVKEQHGDTTQTKLRDELLPTDNEQAADLLVQMRPAITKANPQAAKFALADGTKPRFYQRISQYLAAMSDIEFVFFSRDVTKVLKKEYASAGGYVVCAEHEHAGEHYLLVAPDRVAPDRNLKQPAHQDTK